MATWYWVNIGSDNSLLPDNIKLLSSLILTFDQWAVLYLTTCPRQVKSCFGRVKNSVIIQELCVTCPNLLKMDIWMGAVKSLGRTLSEVLLDLPERAISQEMLNIFILEMSLKIANLILQLHLPWANKLNLNWNQISMKIRINNCHYHGCWWPGNTRSQVICSHGIDLVCTLPTCGVLILPHLLRRQGIKIGMLAAISPISKSHI